MKRIIFLSVVCLCFMASTCGEKEVSVAVIEENPGEEKPEEPSSREEKAVPLPAPPGPLPDRVRWNADGSIMVKVGAGSFMMGSSRTEAEKPRRSVELPLYYIDLTEVTYRQYLAFCSRTGRKPPVTLVYVKPFPEEMNYHPVSNVNWDDADAYCRWAGKRLPSEAEWEKACAGDKGQVYPWGNGWNASACTNRTNSGDRTTRAGARSSCKSPFGLYDMAGNVWEWTADWYRSYPGAPLQFDYTGTKRVARGGAFFYSIDLLRCANRYPLPPDDVSDHGGFRCAATPGPDFHDKTSRP